MQKFLEMTLDKARDLGWTVEQESENVYDFGMFSPAGQDFHISVDTEDDVWLFLENLNERYTSFDCSEEAYIWLDDFGHGKNGAPYEMIDVYNDMVVCETNVGELYNQLYEYACKLDSLYDDFVEETGDEDGEVDNDYFDEWLEKME